MYKQTVSIAPGELLQLDWGRNYQDFYLYFNGEPIGFFEDKAELKLGKRFDLPGEGHRQVMVLLADQGLEVWYNGVDLVSGVRSGSVDLYGRAVNYMLAAGIIILIIACIATWITLSQNSFTWKVPVVFAIGLSFLAQVYYAKKTAGTTPLKIGIGLVAFTFAYMIGIGVTPGIWGIVILAGMIGGLIRGIKQGPLRKPSVLEFDEKSPLDEGI